MAWLVSKPAGAAVQCDLSYVVQNCAVPEVKTLREDGVQPVLKDGASTSGG